MSAATPPPRVWRPAPELSGFELPAYQLAGESWRLVLTGRRTDDSDRCELLVVRDVGGSLALYPHGGARFGARIPSAEAERLARTILGGAE